MSNLPANVAFKRYGYTNTFVNCDTNNTNRLSVSAEDELIVNPKARFIVVPSTKHRGLVHIKSYYSNKFWRSRNMEVHWIFAAAATEPVEDVSAWNSTLFRPELNGNYVMLHHCRNNSEVVVGVHQNMLWITYNRAAGAYFSPMDIDSIVKLPKRVRLYYEDRWVLRGKWHDGHQYHHFDKSNPTGDKTEYEIFYTEDGDIRVKSVYFGKFWRRSPNWIWADSDDTTSKNPDTVFQVVSLGENVVALRNKGNSYFCAGLTTEGKNACLNARLANIAADARLVVDEPVLSRHIQVHYRLKDATICNERPLQIASVTVPNRTDKDHEIQQGFSYTKSKTASWNKTETYKAGVKTSIKCGLPFIADGKIEVSAEYSLAKQFGESETLSQQLTSTYKVPVPAKTKAIVKLLANEAQYDIPFSYNQTDTRYDGKRVSTTFEDGMYRGVESYNFYYDTKYEKL